MNFLAELKRRNVIRMAGLYLVGAWLVTQVAGTILPMFGAPDWIARSIVIVLAVGFVPMLMVSWVFELTPDGIKRDAEIDPAQSFAPRTAQRMNRIIVVLLVAAIGYFCVDTLVLRPRREAALVADTTQAIAQRAAHAKDVESEKSVAVLAFTDLSPGHDQEYFSDGMAEEILNALAQVKDLKVAGRTSSFFYKGRNEDLRTIGKTLDVANILEGSVRKQGDKVRITAQLIRVVDDTHLWSHAYDGDLSDVFALQEKIARAITDQLQVVLEGDQKTRLVPVATTNTQSYTLYLKATDALNKRDYEAMGEAIGWLNQAIALDPDFARAHAQLAMVNVIGQVQYGASLSEVEKQARIAIALDPKLPDPYNALAFLARKQRRFVDARATADRALELAPDDASANLYDGQLLIDTGYTRQGIARLDRALVIDPMLPNALHWRALQYLFAGDTDMAESLWKRASQAGLSYANFGFAEIAKARGDYTMARTLGLTNLLATPGNTDCLQAPRASMQTYLAGAIGGDAAARAKALAVIDECLATKPVVVPTWTIFGLHHFGQASRVLQVVEQGPTTDDAGLFIYFWNPQGRAARQLPEFPAFARRIGFAELWNKYGPPDDCRKNAADNYVCSQ